MSDFELQLICKNIQSAEKSIRQRSLNELLQILKDSKTDVDLSKILNETYLFLVKGYADKYESCRLLTITIVSQFLSGFNERKDFFLEYIVPTMRRRIGMAEMIEDSEELQLQLLEQLLEIVEKFSSRDEDLLMRAYNDIVDILFRNLSNRYAIAQRQCCEIIKNLAVATKSFHMRANCFVDPLITMLSHRQSANRILAVETLGTVCLHITNENDKIVKSIVSISPLLMDSVPNVRKMCGIVGCRWMMDLMDRYSFCERIVPLILCCLKDDLKQIRDEIEMRFIRCGEQYYQENEVELQKLAIIDNDFPCANYKETITVKRPALGCRAIVQRSLCMISIIVNEMIDWKESVRLHALKLLWEMVLYAEEAFTPKFIDVFPVLARCCQDNEPDVVRESQRVAFLMGQLLKYEDWMPHMMKSLKTFPTNLGILRCFDSLFAGADPSLKKQSVDDILKLISTTEISHSLNEYFQSSLLDLVDRIVVIYLENVKGYDQTENNCEKYLFDILVKTVALSDGHENDTIHRRSVEIFNRFCQSDQNRINFQAKYMAEVIECIDDLDCEHSECSERIIRLHGCIKFCGFQKEYFQSIKNAIKLVIENSTPHAKVKVLAAVAVAMLKWNHENSQGESFSLLNEFIREILEPCLIWKAGRDFGAIRAMATQALLSIGDACPSEAHEIFPKLGEHFSSLSEDDLAITRAYAIRCILKSGPFSFGDYNQLTKDLLNKLDDPCSSVRCAAVECVAVFKIDTSDPMYDEEGQSYLAETIISRLILYLDDPFVKMRPILLESLTKLALMHPTLFQNEIDKLPANYPHLEDVENIKMKCDEENQSNQAQNETQIEN